MTRARTPRSKIYDGAFYARILDPLLTPLHRVVAGLVPEGAAVLDVGCGTGNLAVLIAERASRVTGVELSPNMVRYTKRRLERHQVPNVTILAGDVTSAVADVPDGTFDVATMVLALHEMPSSNRVPVLRETSRVARRLMVVDFRVPLPYTIAGLRNRTAELLAGPEHFRAYRDFSRRGGTAKIATAAGLVCRRCRPIGDSTLELCELRGAAFLGQE